MKECANQECSNKFQQVDHRHKYCSSTCASRAKYLEKRKSMPIVKCKLCGDEFRKASGNQIKCVSCRKKDARVRKNRDCPESHPLVKLKNKFLLMKLR